MSESTGRNEWIMRTARIALVVTLSFLGVLLLVGLATGAAYIAETDNWSPLLYLAVLAVFVAAWAAWALLIYGVVKLAVSAESSASLSASRLERIETLLTDQVENTRKLIAEALAD